MKSIAKTPLNKKEINNLIDMALENKLSWKALAHLLKDITSYDPKTAVVALLNTLEKLCSKVKKPLLDKGLDLHHF